MRDLKDTYIFLDIDGTILDFGCKDIYKDTKESIKKAQAKGCNIWINTGRSFSEIPKALLDFGFDGMICSLGTYIITKDKVIYDQRLGKECVNDIRSILKDYSCMEIFEGINGNYAMIDNNSLFTRLVHPLLNYEASLKKDLSNKELADIVKLTLAGVKLDKAISLLKEKYSVITNRKILFYEQYEVTTLNHSKAFGIKKLKELLNKDDFYSVAIGDSNNDIEMLEYANDSYCMKNGSKKAKQYAKHVTSSIKNNGAGEALKDLKIID